MQRELLTWQRIWPVETARSLLALHVRNQSDRILQIAGFYNLGDLSLPRLTTLMAQPRSWPRLWPPIRRRATERDAVPMFVSTVLNSNSRSNRSRTEFGSAAQYCVEPTPALAPLIAKLCLRWCRLFKRVVPAGRGGWARLILTVSPLNIPDPLSRFSSGHTEKASKSKAGGLNRLPLLLLGLGIALWLTCKGFCCIIRVAAAVASQLSRCRMAKRPIKT